MENLNLLYNKLYFKEKNNDKILEQKFDIKSDYIISEIASHKLYMKTCYPGFLIGAGNPHATQANDNDAFKLGFSFDYTTGQPFIPGSSVKGMLRSCFKIKDVVCEILGVDYEKIENIESDIFDKGKDVFLDAVICSGNEEGKFLGKDYVTPHKDVIKNPIPIMFLKILPDVKFEFRFILHDGSITADKKLELFKTILQLFGAGAKTNVGYGILKSTDFDPDAKILNKEKVFDKMQSVKDVSQQMKCPHCGWNNYIYNKNGVKNKNCYNRNCGKLLDK